MKSDHITEAKVLLLEVSTTTLSPSIWHNDVSSHDWGQVSTARGQYYYIKSKYLTQEVRSHHWGHVSAARGQYYYIESKFLTHEGFTTRGHYYYIESKFLKPGCQYTWLRQSFYCLMSVLLHWVPEADTLMSVHIPKAKYLLLEVSTTTLSPSIWHMKSVHITEAKVLLLEVSTTTLSPSF